MTAPETIHELVDKFDQHGRDYRAGKYNEIQLRRDFLDHFSKSTNLVTNYNGLTEEEIKIVEGAA